MADTLVERVTGRDAAVPTPIAVNLVLTDESLLGADSAPADVCGYGPIPRRPPVRWSPTLSPTDVRGRRCAGSTPIPEPGRR